MFIDVGIPAPVKGKSKSYDALRRKKNNNCAGFIFEPLVQGAAEW
jgi:adenosylmethionine-8-amino-7-oxononanoate aminotransferase